MNTTILSRFARPALFALSVAALGTMTGCGVHIATPPGFAELEKGDGYGYRASNAEGVVLAVRREKNDPSGDLTFWSGAVDAQLRRAGYTAVSGHDVSASGVKGKQIRYVIQREGREHAYWVSVFVTKKKVFTVEAGGDKDLFAHQESAIQSAIASLDLG
jgi:hypothetical protein